MKIYKYGMKRPFGMGTFPQKDTIIGPKADNDPKITGFYDILLTSEPLTEKEIYDFDLTPLEKDFLLENIAKKILSIDTLETRNSDEKDFYDISVWQLKKALEEAYDLGVKFSKI